MRRALFVLALGMWPAFTQAGLTEQQIERVAVDPPAGAHVPLTLQFTGLDGHPVSVGDAIDGERLERRACLMRTW